jgi:hypothetical protein
MMVDLALELAVFLAAAVAVQAQQAQTELHPQAVLAVQVTMSARLLAVAHCSKQLAVAVAAV